MNGFLPPLLGPISPYLYFLGGNFQHWLSVLHYTGSQWEETTLPWWLVGGMPPTLVVSENVHFQIAERICGVSGNLHERCELLIAQGTSGGSQVSLIQTFASTQISFTMTIEAVNILNGFYFKKCYWNIQQKKKKS